MKRLCFALSLALTLPAAAWPHRKTPRAHTSTETADTQRAASPASVTTSLRSAQPPPAVQQQPGQTNVPEQQKQPAAAGQIAPQPQPKPPPAPAPRKFGRFDLDVPFAQLRNTPELRACADQLTAPVGHADCLVPKDGDHIERVQLAWEEGRNGPELVALRLLFDPQTAPALTDLEWQLTRGWGPPTLEQLKREHDVKFFTLQWEDPEHRATVEASGPLMQPSRAVAIVLEKKQTTLTGEFAALHPRPFPGFRARSVKRLEFEGIPHALVWGSSLTPAQEAMGESSPAWATQRNYVGLWRLESAGKDRPKRWRPLWERVTGGDEEEEPQRILHIEARDITGDGTPDIAVQLTCETCGPTADEVLVKTVRAGKLVDLLSKRDLYRAQVELSQGVVKIREPEGEDDQGTTVSTYAYDRGKGAFVLAREERVRP